MSAHQPKLYTIFCILIGKDSPFSVEIEESALVDVLKDKIKEEIPNALANVPAHSLVLYQVEINGHDNYAEKTRNKMLEGPPPLDPALPLKDMFEVGPKEGCVHIIVKIPAAIETRKRKISTKDSEYLWFKRRENANYLIRAFKEQSSKEFPSITPEDIASKRQQVVNDHLTDVPASTFGREDWYRNLNEDKFAFNRPPVSQTIPLALLHEIFGQFVEETHTYQPTAMDNGFTQELKDVLSNDFRSGSILGYEFRSAIEKHYGIPLNSASIGASSRPLNEPSVLTEFMGVICEGRLWDGARDPEVEACGHYIATLQGLTGIYSDLLPCIIVYCVGSFIGFAGAVLTDRVQLETLTPSFPVYTNLHEDEIDAQISRAFGAFKMAYQRLQEHYKMVESMRRPLGMPANDIVKVMFPYPTHYTDDKGDHIPFTYECQLAQRRLLFAATTTAGEDIFIKFTRKYSKEAHQYCANRGIAPRLDAVECLPGGWKMVVMKYLEGEDYEYFNPRFRRSARECELRIKEARRVVHALHDGGFVHGDIRLNNFMMSCHWDAERVDGNVLLIDFDWAGVDGMARYPANVNTVTVSRPDGVTDGVLITKEHDLAMVDRILSEFRN